MADTFSDLIAASPAIVDALDTQCIRCELVDRTSLDERLMGVQTPCAVVVEASDITIDLAALVNAAIRRTGISIGIIPIELSNVRHVVRQVSFDAGTTRESARIGVSSVVEQVEALAGLPPLVTKISKREVYTAVTAGEWTAIALTTNGRMTYLQLGEDGWLHSDPAYGRESVATPVNVRCDHWLIQSCHSPFSWPEMPGMESVPISLLTKGNARSVICSCRAQHYVPGLLHVYLDSLLAGSTAGEIVCALNDFCNRWFVDCDPFVLLGHPGARAIEDSGHRQSARERNRRAPVSQQRTSAAALASIAQNVRFLSEESHFGLQSKLNEIQRDCEKARPSPTLNYEQGYRAMQGAVAELTNAINARCIHLRAALGPAADEPAQVLDMWTKHLSLNVPSCFGKLERSIEEVFTAFPAYCYHLGEQIERPYIAVHSNRSYGRCPSCKSFLMRRVGQYVGPFPAHDYDHREWCICPRCFVVRDMNEIVAKSTDAECRFVDRAMQARVRFSNRGCRPRWVFAFSRITECQNLAPRCDPGEYRGLVNSIPLKQIGRWKGRMLAPGEHVEFDAVIETVPQDIFYFQLEYHLFVDFGWNWQCFTFFGPGVRNFLQTKAYKRQFVSRSGANDQEH